MAILPVGFKNEADPWDVLFQYKEKNRPIIALVGAIDYMDDKLTWVLTLPDFPGIKGLVPAQETGVDELLWNRFVGMEIEVIVKGLDMQNSMVACSRREAVESAEKRLKEQLSIGDIIPVIVKAIIYKEKKSFLIVDAGSGVLVEIRRSQAAVHLARTLKAQYTIGKKVNAMVVSIDPLDLSIKKVNPDPWSQADYKRGQFISGVVQDVNKNKIYIEPDLTPGIIGLATMPLMGDIQKGYRVTCKVRYFSSDVKKLHLAIIDRLL